MLGSLCINLPHAGLAFLDFAWFEGINIVFMKYKLVLKNLKKMEKLKEENLSETPLTC
jgi:hypothetical protein